MSTVNVLDQTGSVRETLTLSDDVFAVPAKAALVHQAVVRELASRRAGTHDTKGRSEVSGGGRKPWRQKGTGRARQGSTRATQWRGGGKPFGPTPRSYSQAMPRQARRHALRAVLSDALRGGRLAVIDAVGVAEPKTKVLLGALARYGLGAVSTLLVVGERTAILDRASRNVPWLTVVPPDQVTVAEVLRHERVVCERTALVALQEALSS